MIDALGPAQRMLTAIVNHFNDEGWDLPARRYLSGGNPADVAADDEHLFVALDRITPGASDVSSRGGGLPSRGVGAIAVPRASYVIRLMRCCAGLDDEGNIPSAAVLTADAQRLLADPGRLLTALFKWRENEPLATNPNGTVTIGQVDTVGPSGYLAGCAVIVTLSPVQ